jgi:hypothetical protein
MVSMISVIGHPGRTPDKLAHNTSNAPADLL